ncbi:MAG: hypothetical protein AAB217_06995 [Chloroflexota bacterium]
MAVGWESIVPRLVKESGLRQTERVKAQAANPRRSEMKSSQLNKSRFVIGIVLVVIAVLMFLFAKGDYSTAGAIGIGVLGLISIAISRRR